MRRKKASNSTSLNDVKKTVLKWLELDDLTVIEVLLGSVVANLLSTDPFWLLLIAPPSSAKTELLRALTGFEKTYPLSSLTPQTLISGKVTKKNQTASLLPKLNDKIIIHKDFTSILSMRQESRQEVLTQLREIYDGKYSKVFGTGIEIHWEGKVGFIAGCTTIIDKYHSVNQMLGERFLQFRLTASDPKKVGLRAKACVGKEVTMRKELQDVFTNFLNQFLEKEPFQIKEVPEIDNKLISLAAFCAIARTGVSRDRYTQVIDVLPEAEGPGRLMKQLTQLGIALTMIFNKSSIDSNIYQILKKVGLDTLSGPRERLIREMWSEGHSQDLMSWEKTKGIGELIELPTTTVRLLLEDLHVLGLMNRKMEDEESDKRQPYFWQLSNTCIELIQEAELFKQDDADLTGIPF